ncbi:alanine/glycine:cation symporter family protein [Shimia sp. Alg240-R146]|uniref:alanine/glycine:cation symporter family protein n=1 Tax=Shimia sp. Alg240-R146 TaxID=2993449 RepID=UPI0022E0EAD2|nr:alanine/glycine:cation symporter family protein [Shimia sp. Alg240-R146]
MSTITTIITEINSLLWDNVLIYALLGLGLYFTARLGFVQFRNFGEMIRLALSSDDSDKEGISPFQALAVSLASRIGTGNLAGVAVAISLGGPGAIFWMWVVALLGMGTAFAEAVLAQLYKTHGPNGTYRGGPAFYMARGMKMPKLGYVFAIVMIFAFGLIFNAVQGNAIAESMERAFAFPKLNTGVVLAIATGLVIFGGFRQITRVASILVPFMAVGFIAVTLWIMAVNITEVPHILKEIVLGAFGLQEAVGGVAGGMMAALINGVIRGLFSSEAGMGSAPNIAASATPVPHHPASQGYVQMLGVFVDTMLVCTATAVMILLADAHLIEGVEGIAMTQAAATHFMGPFGEYFIALSILLFAFTTIIACYTYAEAALIYMKLTSWIWMAILRLAVMGFVIWGAVEAVLVVFLMADTTMGILATLNLFALAMMSGVVIKLGRDYRAQRAAGETPTFHIADHPDMADGVEADIWK